MKFGLFASQKQQRRSETAKDVMCRPGLQESESQEISKYLKIEKGFNYGFRFLVFPGLFLLYKKKYFEKQSRFMVREIAIVLGSLGFIALGDYLGSEIMWGNTERIVRKYTQYTENPQQIRQNNIADIQAQKQKNQEVTSDRLYDDDE